MGRNDDYLQNFALQRRGDLKLILARHAQGKTLPKADFADDIVANL